MSKEDINTGWPNDRYATPGVNLFSFLEMINCTLELRRYANQNGRWFAVIENSETKEGCILTGSGGNGKSPEQAIEDYVRKIRGKLLVVNAATDKRKEFKVPNGLYFLAQNPKP